MRTSRGRSSTSRRLPRTRATEHRLRRADTAIVVLYLLSVGSTLAWRIFYVGVPPVQLAGDASLLLTGAVVIALRRRRTRVVFAVAALFILAALVLGLPADLFVLFVVVYSVAAYRLPRTGVLTWAGLSVLAAVNISVLHLVYSEPARVGRWQVSLLFLLGVGAAALLIGLAVGNRRRYVASLVQLTEELAAERDRSAQLAAQAERTRIARDMHDVLSHGLQVIVSSADAASAIWKRDPDTARQLVAGIADAGRRSMGEARTVFTLLNDNETEANGAPQPTLSSVPELIERARRAGLDIEFAEYGEPHLDATGQLVVYRVLQESLTNALRHAGVGAKVVTELTHAPGRTTLDVTDDGPPAGFPRASTSPGSGSGLRGMKHRAGAVSGTLRAGPREGRPGWRVSASIPTAHPGTIQGPE